jgi:hypothetical protein
MKAKPELGAILAKAVCDIMKGGSLGLYSPSDSHRLLILTEYHFAVALAKACYGLGDFVGATQ